MDALHEVLIEGVACFSSGQCGEGPCETAAACSWTRRTTRAPERKVGFGGADIMLAGAAGRFAAGGVLARSATGVFKREEWEIKEERVQLEALKSAISCNGSRTIPAGSVGRFSPRHPRRPRTYSQCIETGRHSASEGIHGWAASHRPRRCAVRFL